MRVTVAQLKPEESAWSAHENAEQNEIPCWEEIRKSLGVATEGSIVSGKNGYWRLLEWVLSVLTLFPGKLSENGSSPGTSSLVLRAWDSVWTGHQH